MKQNQEKSEPKRIAIMGECMIELNGQPFGTMQQTYGGDTLNAAIYLNRGCEASETEADVKVDYVTALGADPLSDALLSRWQEEKIGTDLVLRDPQRSTGLYLIQLDDHGERTFLYWRDNSAAKFLVQHPDFSTVKQALPGMDMIFLSGISLAILPPADRVALFALLDECRQAGCQVSYDSNFRPALWREEGGSSDDQYAIVKTVYQQMYARTDLALVTFEDEQAIWGDATPEETVERLRAHGIREGVVKLGPQGCLCFDGDQIQVVATTPVENVVDTTSAGDSFNGGFLSAYLTGHNLTQCCQRGNALAGAVIQHCGAIIDKAISHQAIRSCLLSSSL